MSLLPFDEGNGLSTSVFEISNWMVFPDNPQRRRELGIDFLANPAFWPTGTVPVDFLMMVREIPGRPQLRQYYDAAVNEGKKAGMILRAIASLELVEKRHDLASLNCVRRGIEHLAKAKYKDYSTRHLEGIWTRFSSVAHLWAAWIGRDYRIENWAHFEDEAGAHSLTFLDDLKLLLLEAEEFADFGENHKHSASNKAETILKSGVARRVDPGLRASWRRALLPCPIPGRGRASVRPLDTSFLKAAETARAKK